MEKCLFLCLVIVFLTSLAARSSAAGESEGFRFKDEYLRLLVAEVPDILKTQDPNTGRFGQGIWIVNDQHPMYPLAAAWSIRSDQNPYYHDPKVLEAVMAAGDALIEDQAPDGQWEFRKKDGSTWGMIYQPWTYSRWIRAYGLIRGGMPADRRKKWEDALVLGFTGISRTCLQRVHNIPTHDAMALYLAGQLLNRPKWSEQAKEFMKKVVEEQDPGGFWSEHYGPVVSYNFVYSDALGTYYAISHDRTVLPALERAAKFHANFVYPDGSKVETIDERNPYHSGVAMGNVGFTFTPEGRGYLLQQTSILKREGRNMGADACAGFLLYGQEGPAVPTAAAETDRTYVMDNKALVRRKGPWFICMSAYCCPVPQNRWIQDRQNFVSVYHDKCGLILGGGNTKLQPLWSSFTVGDVSLLKHKKGDTAPEFVPPAGLIHVPSAADLKEGDPPALSLVYGKEQCSIQVDPVDENTLTVHLKSNSTTGRPVAGHLTLIPHLGRQFRTELTPERKLSDEPFALTSAQAGRWIEHSGWRLTIPEGASVIWPVLPHDPYKKDGAATAGAGRIVVTLPLSSERQEYALTLTVGK